MYTIIMRLMKLNAMRIAKNVRNLDGPRQCTPPSLPSCSSYNNDNRSGGTNAAPRSVYDLLNFIFEWKRFLPYFSIQIQSTDSHALSFFIVNPLPANAGLTYISSSIYDNDRKHFPAPLLRRSRHSCTVAAVGMFDDLSSRTFQWPGLIFLMTPAADGRSHSFHLCVHANASLQFRILLFFFFSSIFMIFVE